MPPRPPLANTMRLELNWTASGGATAHNIAYCQFGVAVDTSVPDTLTAAANALHSACTTGTGNLLTMLASGWSLASVTAADNSGTSENFNNSTNAPVAGTGTGSGLPPQVAVCLSWQIAARYRGGKPRWYIPGIPSGALVSPYAAVLTTTFATGMKTAGNNLEASFNSASIATHSAVLGTISYRTGGAARPTPLFRAFGACEVHERLDSQRRRSGKESAYGVIV